MADQIDLYRIMIPEFPSLCHLSTVKVALDLWSDFDSETVQEAFDIIEQGIPFDSLDHSEDPWVVKVNRARKRLLFIPTHLRKTVMEAVHGLEYAATRWKWDQLKIIHFEVKDCEIYWKSDGRVNGIKSAQQLVSRTSIDIKQRFILACKFCFEESIQTLWAELEASGKTDNWKTSTDCVVNFWLKRMHDGSQVPWTLDIQESIRNRTSGYLLSRYSLVFPSLRLEERKRFLRFLKFADDDDFLLCLYSLTKEEGDAMLQSDLYKLTNIALQWPFRSCFSKLIEKIWSYIDEYDFRLVMYSILHNVVHRRDYDFCKLLEEFWNESLIHLKEIASLYGKIINLDFEEAKRMKKAFQDERINSLKQLIETKIQICRGQKLIKRVKFNP